MLDKKKYPRILTAGDSCLVIEFGDKISMDINRKVLAMQAEVEKKPFAGFVETVPSYRSLAVCFNAAATDLERLYALLKTTYSSLEKTSEFPLVKRTLILPTLYGGEYGEDIEFVAAHTELSVEQVIKRHTEREYYCYMLGFTPGFAYLGGMDERLKTPRLKEPRQIVPAGAVGIAGSQTGFYSISSPGGWQLIGRTPVNMFDPLREPPFFLEAGMWVRFRSIGLEEYQMIRESSAKRIYAPEIIINNGETK